MILVPSISARMLLLLTTFLALDVYTFFGIRSLFKNSKYLKLYYFLFFSSVLLSYLGLINMMLYFRDTINSTELSNLLRGFTFSFFIFKLLVVIFLVINDLERFLHLLYDVVLKFFVNTDKKITPKSRRKFITQMGLFIAAVPFSSLLYGITKGKYDFNVIKHSLHFKNLPKSFDKLRIVHISDIHAGSFDNVDCVQKGIELIQNQRPDIILFSGDLVNNDAREIEPYLSLFRELNAPLGKFAVLGNHDYGDYKQWDSENEKQANLGLLFDQFKSMDFNLLNNTNSSITLNNESITIIGVENWGRPPFKQKGDLETALNGADNPFKILLSHDPSHWDLVVKDHPSKIDLTLSGHTHGMQFGVEIPGIKWSPVQYIYEQWAGLYQYKNQFINVNRGFGFIGYPGRVGIWPEITVIELNSEN